MRLSRWSYYADLVVYPVLIAAVETFSLLRGPPARRAHPPVHGSTPVLRRRPR